MQVTPWILDPTKCNLTSIRLPIGLCPAASPCGFSVPALVINDLPALMTDDRCPLFRPDQSRTANLELPAAAAAGWARDRPAAAGSSGFAFRRVRVCFSCQRSCSRCPVPLILCAASLRVATKVTALALAQRWSHSHLPARRVAKRRTAARSDRVHVRSSGQPWVTNGQMK